MHCQPFIGTHRQFVLRQADYFIDITGWKLTGSPVAVICYKSFPS